MAAAKVAASKLELSDTDANGQKLDHSPKIHIGGGGVTGTAFVDNTEFREWTHTTFVARVLDMETAAIAQVAEANGVPFLALVNHNGYLARRIDALALRCHGIVTGNSLTKTKRFHRIVAFQRS